MVANVIPRKSFINHSRWELQSSILPVGIFFNHGINIIFYLFFLSRKMKIIIMIILSTLQIINNKTDIFCLLSFLSTNFQVTFQRLINIAHYKYEYISAKVRMYVFMHLTRELNIKHGKKYTGFSYCFLKSLLFM